MADTENLVNQVFLEIAGLPQERCVELLGDLISLTVESSLHFPDVASLVVHDSNLQWIDQAALEPGKALKVSAKSEDATHPIFDGEIVEVEPDFAPHAQRLVIRAFETWIHADDIRATTGGVAVFGHVEGRYGGVTVRRRVLWLWRPRAGKAVCVRANDLGEAEHPG